MVRGFSLRQKVVTLGVVTSVKTEHWNFRLQVWHPNHFNMLPPWGDGLITDWVTELVEYQNASTPDHQPMSINSWIEGILGDPGAVSRARRKVTTKVFKHGLKSPWVPTLTRPFPKGQANAGSWLGTKNALYYCAQSVNSFSWVLFVSLYTTAIILPQLPGSFTKLS